MSQPLTAEQMQQMQKDYQMGSGVDEIAYAYEVSKEFAQFIVDGTGPLTLKVQQAGKRAAQRRWGRDGNKSIDNQIQSLERELQLANAKLKELKALRAIEFEYDNLKQKVTISGVDRFFLANGGVAKFREWLVKNFSVE